jgi:RHS repeat-associated protein
LNCELVTLDSAGPIGGTFYAYGSGAQVTNKKEYDYGLITSTSACQQGSSPPTGITPTRETAITYQSFANTPIYPNGRSIFDRPSSVVACNATPCSSGGANRVSETDYTYDGPGLQSAAVTVGRDASYNGNTTVPRGNATTKSVWLNTTNSFLTTSYTYDDTSQLLSVTDPKGNPPTQYSYTDSWLCPPPQNCGTPPASPTNAYLTKITRPPTNGKNHIENFSYGYADGQLTSSTDENSQKTSYVYADSLGRLTEIDYPDTGQTTLAYSDAGPNPSVTTTRKLSSTGSPGPFTTKTLTDGVGHVVKTQVTSDPAGTNSTDTTYDGMGRVRTVSNPYRSTSDASYGITSYAYDALGRVTSITRPDSTAVRTVYTGRASSVTDEGNGSVNVQRVSQTDALGRLTSVCEASSASVIGAIPAACGQDISATGFLTTYQYDALDNLSGVSQGGQTRTFVYDSLSRLLSATNPEPGATSYSYDANGNVLTKQDARGVMVTYASATCPYDALNRISCKTYSDGTPRANFYYDESSVALGSWTSPALANPIGRITHATTVNSGGALLTARVNSYEPMGRTADFWQCTPSTCGVASYGVDYTYDLVGNQKTLSTSGRTYTLSYNAADRLTGLTSSVVDAQHPGTLLGTVSYAAVGLANATLGNNVTETRTYNKRAWLSTLTDTVPSAGAPATGSLTVAGTEKSQPILASPATGSVTISGSERSKVIDPCPGGGCPKTIWDAGTVSITVNGFTKSTTYDQTSTSSTIASSLASAFNGDSTSPVTASVSGSTVSLTTKQTGANVNYPLSASSATTNTQNFTGTSFPVSTSGSRLTGGHDASTLWDAGTVALTVNGAPKSVTYGQSSTASSLAQSLTTAVNGDTSYPVTATLSGATLSLTTRQAGSSADYSLSTSVSTNYPSNFSPPSFATSTSGSTLTGGGTTNSVALTYAGDGDILSASDTVNGNWSYGYDASNRLISAGKSGLSFTYDYDRYGNRWHQNVTSGSGPAPQLSFDATTNRINSAGYSYDAAGNLLSDGTCSYTYDAENRLTSATCMGTTTTYTYDAEGRRVAKAVGGSITEEYVYDLAGHVISQFGSYPTSAWVRDEIYAGERHLATYRNGTTYFNHADWLGTERARSDMTGAMCETITSLPFGDGQATSGACGDPSPNHFTGKERDSESGLDNFGARYDSSSLGRFMSPDPMGGHQEDPQTMNRYSYVRNNPLNLTDPTGLDFWLQGGNACGNNGVTCDKKGFVLDSNNNRVLIGNSQLRDSNSGDSANFDTNGVHITTAQGTFRGQFAAGTPDTRVEGAGDFGGMHAVFNSDCGGTCNAGGALFGTKAQFDSLLPKLLKNPGMDNVDPFHPGTDQYRGGNKEGPDAHLSFKASDDPNQRDPFHFDNRYPYGSAGGFGEHTGGVFQTIWNSIEGKQGPPLPKDIPIASVPQRNQ